MMTLGKTIKNERPGIATLYAKMRYAEPQYIETMILTVIMLSIIMTSGVIMSVFYVEYRYGECIFMSVVKLNDVTLLASSSTTLKPVQNSFKDQSKQV